ncbi:hypothetical protein EYR38_004886 [Pleurotus pulmonarius]|nr:hypothetical protein EYR38_004886 [Pleurotus pulmonarius]
MKDTLLRTFGRGKEKERANASIYGSSIGGPSSTISNTSLASPAPSSSSSAYKGFGSPNPPPVRQTNVFSLVERFTFRPSASEAELPNAPPKLPQEIQYWAGVIMRNACRKDESRGGIRQCANMLCGRWESYPREFAKCRRCRKAKYCGKECQSTAWSEGHRFWCSAKDGDDETVHAHESSSRSAAAAAAVASATPGITPTLDTDGAGAVRVTIIGDAIDMASGEIANAGEGLAVTPGGTIRAGTRQRVMALEPRARPTLPGPSPYYYDHGHSRFPRISEDGVQHLNITPLHHASPQAPKPHTAVPTTTPSTTAYMSAPSSPMQSGLRLRNERRQMRVRRVLGFTTTTTSVSPPSTTILTNAALAFEAVAPKSLEVSLQFLPVIYRHPSSHGERLYVYYLQSPPAQRPRHDLELT